MLRFHANHFDKRNANHLMTEMCESPHKTTVTVFKWTWKRTDFNLLFLWSLSEFSKTICPLPNWLEFCGHLKNSLLGSNIFTFFYCNTRKLLTLTIFYSSHQLRCLQQFRENIFFHIVYTLKKFPAQRKSSVFFLKAKGKKEKKIFFQVLNSSLPPLVSVVESSGLL